MACHSDSPLTVASDHYWPSTLFSDHHLPHLVVVTHPIAREEKPHPDATSRTAEHHLLQVALSPEEEAHYTQAVAARRPTHSQKPRNCGSAAYSGLCVTGHKVTIGSGSSPFGHTVSGSARWSGPRRLEHPYRNSRTPIGIPGARYAAPSADLPAARTRNGGAPQGPEALKRAPVALGEAQKRQCLRDLQARGMQRLGGRDATRNLCRTPEQWREVQRCTSPPKHINEVPVANMLLLNPREILASLRQSRECLQGHSYRIQDDPMRWRVFQTCLHLLPKAPPRALGEYVQPRHLYQVQAGKACGPDLALPEADVCIDITRYRHLSDADQRALCLVMRDPHVCWHVGKRGRVTLLLKDPSRPVEEANIREITVSPHVPKLEPVAFYSRVYERALGGPFLVGGHIAPQGRADGPRGTGHGPPSRTEHRRPHRRPGQILRRHCPRRPPDSGQPRGARYCGSPPCPRGGVSVHHAEGYRYTMPLGTLQGRMLQQHLGIPQGMIQGVHVGPTVAVPFVWYMGDTITIFARGPAHTGGPGRLAHLLPGATAGRTTAQVNRAWLNPGPYTPAVPRRGCGGCARGSTWVTDTPEARG